MMIGIGSLNWPGFYRMVARGIPAKGTVIELLPNMHNSVRYRYAVNDQIFEGQMQSWSPNPPLQQLTVGQSLVIYYDPEHPNESVLGDPKPMLKNETISVAAAAFVLPTFAVAVWARRASRKHTR
jgi:hypothetical protein